MKLEQLAIEVAETRIDSVRFALDWNSPHLPDLADNVSISATVLLSEGTVIFGSPLFKGIPGPAATLYPASGGSNYTLTDQGMLQDPLDINSAGAIDSLSPKGLEAFYAIGRAAQIAELDESLLPAALRTGVFDRALINQFVIDMISKSAQPEAPRDEYHFSRPHFVFTDASRGRVFVAKHFRIGDERSLFFAQWERNADKPQNAFIITLNSLNIASFITYGEVSPVDDIAAARSLIQPDLLKKYLQDAGFEYAVETLHNYCATQGQLSFCMNSSAQLLVLSIGQQIGRSGNEPRSGGAPGVSGRNNGALVQAA